MDNFWRIMGWTFGIFMFIAWMGMGMVVDDAVAKRAMADNGYTDVKIVDRSNFWPWFNGCDGSDAVAWQVTAKRNDHTVRVIVCSGVVFKGVTLRSPN